MKKIKFLVVDDSSEWIKFHLNILNNLFPEIELEIKTAYSAREGVSKALKTENPYDIVITDLEMEDTILGHSCAGEWLLSNLVSQENCKTTQFLIVSGSYDIDQIAKKFDVGFIAKNELLGNPMLLKYKLDEMLGR